MPELVWREFTRQSDKYGKDLWTTFGTLDGVDVVRVMLRQSGSRNRGIGNSQYTSTTFSLADPRYFSYGYPSLLGSSDRHPRDEKSDDHTSIPKAKRWIVSHTSLYDIYRATRAGDKNTDNGPIEWKAKPKLEDRAVAKRVTIDDEPKTRTETFRASEPDRKTDTRQTSKKEPLINRHRPKTWKELIGHLTQVSSLRSALKDSQVFLITGIPGVGKTTAARLTAAELGAAWIREINSADYTGVDAMRALIESFEYSFGGVRVIIFDECHKLTSAAQDAMLKFLEEPPPGLYIFMCTTNPSKILDTVISRCVPINLQPVGTNQMLTFVEKVVKKEGWDTPKEVWVWCAQQAIGAPRTALTLLAACHHCKTREEAAQLLRRSTTVSDSGFDLGYRLAQVLTTPRLSDCQKLLREVDETNEDVEGICMVVRRYFTRVWLDDDGRDKRACHHASMILFHFDESISELSSLIHVIQRVISGGSNGKSRD